MRISSPENDGWTPSMDKLPRSFHLDVTNRFVHLLFAYLRLQTSFLLACKLFIAYTAALVLNLDARWTRCRSQEVLELSREGFLTSDYDWDLMELSDATWIDSWKQGWYFFDSSLLFLSLPTLSPKSVFLTSVNFFPPPLLLFFTT